MQRKRASRAWLVVVTAAVVGFSGWAAAAEEETPAQAGEQTGVEGTFVRVATNEEGWVVLGYRIANESVGKDWMLLDVGMTVMKGRKAQKITRDDIKLVTPDHKAISLPTQEEYEKVRSSLLPLVKRASMAGDSINYFPPPADSPCRIGFFADPGVPGMMLADDDAQHPAVFSRLGVLDVLSSTPPRPSAEAGVGLGGAGHRPPAHRVGSRRGKGWV